MTSAKKQPPAKSSPSRSRSDREQRASRGVAAGARKKKGAGPGSPPLGPNGETRNDVAGDALRPGDALEVPAEHLRRAFELSPGNVGLARLLSDVLESAGEPQEALAVLEKASKHAPADAELLVELGYARLSNGDAAQARKAFERALSLRPRDILVRRPLAQIYESMGDAALAAETLAAIPQETASARLLGDLAILYLNLDRYQDAAGVFRRLQATDPDHVLLAQHGLTFCMIKSQNWRGALDVALETIKLDRFDLTTNFLAYAKDRLFSRVPDAERVEADLRERLIAELREHAEQHEEDEAVGRREEGIPGV
jgi:Flp pilus assembly protein TadD